MTKYQNALRARVYKKYLMLIFLNVSFNYFQPAWNILTFVERHIAFQFVRSKKNVSSGLSFYVYPSAAQQLPGIYTPCSSSFMCWVPIPTCTVFNGTDISASVSITVHCFCQKAEKLWQNCFLWKTFYRNSIFHWNNAFLENFQPTALKIHFKSAILEPMNVSI